jgi:hypothetical protein
VRYFPSKLRNAGSLDPISNSAASRRLPLELNFKMRRALSFGLNRTAKTFLPPGKVTLHCDVFYGTTKPSSFVSIMSLEYTRKSCALLWANNAKSVSVSFEFLPTKHEREKGRSFPPRNLFFARNVRSSLRSLSDAGVARASARWHRRGTRADPGSAECGTRPSRRESAGTAQRFTRGAVFR